jgi:hypothetical protein
MTKYTDMPFKEWDGTSLLCLKDDDRCFSSKEEIEEYCSDKDIFPEALQLIICEPVYGEIIKPDQFWDGDIPEEEELQYWWPELYQKIQEVNRLIIDRKNSGNPWSWFPGKYRTTVNLKGVNHD